MNLKEANEQTLISCGSWVSFSLRNNGNLKKVIIIGPSSLTIHSNDCSYVEVFPIDISHEVSIHTILSHIHTETIYVSIDKDVLGSKSHYYKLGSRAYEAIYTFTIYSFSYYE